MDKELVRYIISNLISNAIKFSPQGSIVKFEIFGTLGNHVEFNIEDHGVGIPEKDLSSIFEPFHRGENVTEYQGTGLGLSIVKRCVETHLGSIKIESNQGKGTNVNVRLPIIENKVDKS
jgi:signal transduction histidine kinase